MKTVNLIPEDEYPKLVRDKIPELILARGEKPETRILSDEEYLKYLLKKVVEESVELYNSAETGNTKEELADVLELIEIILKFNGWNTEEILKIKADKRKKNGGFGKKILLLKKP